MPVFDGPAYTNLILTAASSILALVVAVFAWYHRRITGALHLAVLSSLGFIWGLIYLLELLAKTSEYKLYFDDLQFIPVSFLGPVFFVLAMVFAGQSAVVRRPVWTLLYVIPTLTIIMVSTNHFHQLFRRVPVSGSNTEDWLLPAQPIHGPWFWVIVAYSVALIIAAAAILLYTYLHSPRWSRGRVGILLISAMVMTGAVALSLPAWLINSPANITLISLLIAIIVLAYGMLGDRMLDTIPLAGSTLLNQLSDAVITLNVHGEILDCNPSAAGIPQLNITAHIGESFPEVIRHNAGHELKTEWAIDHSEEITLGERTYDMRISPLTGTAKKTAGLMVVLRDITRRKIDETERIHIQERYRAIFENTSYGILLLGQEGNILESNDQFIMLSGYTPDQLRTYSLQELIPLAPDLTIRPFIEPVPTEEVALLQANGDYLPVELNITPISGGTDTAFFITLQDIRERKLEENTTKAALENAQLRAEELATLRTVTEALNQATSLRHALLPVLETVNTITQSSSVWLYLLNSGPSGHQRIEYHPLDDNNLIMTENLHGREPKCLAKLLEGSLSNPRVIKDCRCSTLTSEASHYAFPLNIGKQPLGMLNFTEDKEMPVSDNKIRLLQTICDSLSVVIERVRLFKSEHDQRRLAETMRDIGTALTTSLDLNEILDLLLDQLSRLIPYDGGSVMLVEDGHAVITRTRGYELSTKKNLALLQGQRFKVEATANLASMFATKRPVIIPDTALEKTFLPTPVSTDYHGWLGVPIINDGKVEAIFSLDKVEPGFYTDEHAKLLSVFSTQASLAIKNARLFSAEKRRIKELDGLRATLTDISSQLDANVLLKEIVKRAMVLLNAEVGELGIYEPEEQLVRILVSENFNPDTVGMTIGKGEGLMGRVAQTKKPLTVMDYSHWSGRMSSYENQQLYSGLAVPMLAGSGEMLGVLTVGYIRREHKFNENDIRLLNLFAQQATVALRNARLFEEAKRRAEEAETIRKAGAVVVSTLNQEKAIDLILEQLAQVVPYDSASVLLYKKGALQIVGGHGFSDIQPILGLEIALDRGNPGAVVFLDNQPGILMNIPEEAPQFNQVSHHNNHIIHSWLGVPLKIQNQPIGILSLDGHKAGQFNKEHERLVIAFADQVAIALENARLYESALQSASRFETLYKLSQVISANIRSEEIYPAIHEATSELMETEFFSISLVNESEGLVEDVYMVDRGEPVQLTSRPLGQGLFGRVLENGKSILFNSFEESMIEETGAVIIGDPEEDEISQSIIVVPLKIGTRMVGVLSAQSYQPNAYTDTDLELLELLGANVAIAIENARLFSEVQELAVTDPLTGLYNRRKLIELGEPEFNRSLRYERDLSAIMVDCDHFKSVNDTYGHAVGDQVLQRLAEICTTTLRRSDILSRYGGDEFMVIMPETNPRAALMAAERLRQNVSSAPFETNVGQLSFSISVGVASLNKSCKSLEQLLERADFASYVSKDTGGNRVTRWTPSISRTRGDLKANIR